MDVPDYMTCSTMLERAIDQFNEELYDVKSELRLKSQTDWYTIRIGKKKNGKPSTDYPALDLTQHVVNVDFKKFCIVY